MARDGLHPAKRHRRGHGPARQAQQEQTEHSSAGNWAGEGPESVDVSGEEDFYKLFWELDRESMEAYLGAAASLRRMGERLRRGQDIRVPRAMMPAVITSTARYICETRPCSPAP